MERSMNGGAIGRWRLLLILPLCGVVGCAEFVLEGIVSDRHTSRPIPAVRIEQQRGGGWRGLGETDGKGRYWILKADVGGGGRVRMSKEGYFPAVVSESEFVGGQSFLLVPSEESTSDFEDLLRREGADD